MKILILVQSVNKNRYPELIKLQKETWDSIDHPEVQTMFYYPDLGETRIEDKNIYIKGSTEPSFMFNQCIAAMKETLLYSWDYLFKTDNSAYVSKKELVKILNDKPREEYYGGQLYIINHPDIGCPFLWGEGIALSRDVVEFLVKVYDNLPGYKYGPEDVHIGATLHNRFEWDKTLLIYQTHKNKERSLSKNHIYRCCNDESKDDKFNDIISTMKEIHSILVE